jgi:hypothetical protein
MNKSSTHSSLLIVIYPGLTLLDLIGSVNCQELVNHHALSQSEPVRAALAQSASGNDAAAYLGTIREDYPEDWLLEDPSGIFSGFDHSRWSVAMRSQSFPSLADLSVAWWQVLTPEELISVLGMVQELWLVASAGMERCLLRLFSNALTEYILLGSISVTTPVIQLQWSKTGVASRNSKRGRQKSSSSRRTLEALG